MYAGCKVENKKHLTGPKHPAMVTQSAALVSPHYDEGAAFAAATHTDVTWLDKPRGCFHSAHNVTANKLCKHTSAVGRAAAPPTFTPPCSAHAKSQELPVKLGLMSLPLVGRLNVARLFGSFVFAGLTCRNTPIKLLEEEKFY